MRRRRKSPPNVTGNDSPPDPAPTAEAGEAGGRSFGARLLDRLARLKRPLIAVAAVGTVLSGLAGYWNAWRTWHLGTESPSSVAPATAPPSSPATAAVVHRMSFAVLPVTAPGYLPDGATVARLVTEQLHAEQELRTSWTRVVKLQQSVAAAASAGSTSDIGRALGAQFLLRGSLERSAGALTAQIAVLDAQSERVLGTHPVAVDPTAVPPANPHELEAAVSRLTYDALLLDVQRSRSKPDEALDAGELDFRAWATWGSGKPDAPSAYAAASALIDRALAIAPDDLLSLRIKAQINLCECLQAWAKDADAKERIGIEALDRVLVLQPDSIDMLELRAEVYLRHARYDDALAAADRLLQRDADNASALTSKALALLRLGRSAEAVPLVPRLLHNIDLAPDPRRSGTAAAVLFETGDFQGAAQAVRRAVMLLNTSGWRADPLVGSVVLTLAASEARLQRPAAARLALDDFRTAVPAIRTAAELKTWLLPHSPVPESAAFYAALTAAGLGASR